MCGLSGSAGSIVFNDEKVCKDLLWYNTLRGTDATGIATVPRDGRSKWKISKAAVAADVFLETRRFNDVMSGQHKVVLQHNRKATGGGKTEGFAHPWDFTHIVGAHNGSATLEEIKKIPGNEDCLLDSYGILNSIDLYGPIETYKQITHYDKGSEFQNAWAVTWYDKSDGSMNFLRNWKRPLHVVFNDKHEVIYWSSEIGHLTSATNRNGVKRLEGEKSFSIPVDMWVKFVVPPYGKPFEKPVVRPVTYKQPAVYSGGSGHYPFPSARATSGPPSTGSKRQVWNMKTHKWEDKDESETTFQGSRAAAQASVNRGHPTGTLTGNDAIRDENERKQSLGNGKFTLVYQDEDTRVYYDSNLGIYFRYWWNQHDTQWEALRVTGIPAEIPKGYDVLKHVADKLPPLDEDTGRPLARPPKPDHQPVLDLSRERVRLRGRRNIVTKFDGNWRLYHWDDQKASWYTATSYSAPACLPDYLYDVDACHYFKVSGRKKRRNVRFKGFNGKLLEMEKFNEITHAGCIVCGRTPTWNEGKFGGVHVSFVNNNHEFLCDFCAEDDKLIKDVLTQGTQDSTKLIQEKNKRSMN